jgi:Uma2 family endonuclease
MSTAPAKRRFTVSEYLAFEVDSLSKHEFYRGEILAMAGATIAHNIIAANVLSNLHARLRGKDCRPFGSDQRIKVEDGGLFTYADVTVICGDVVPAKDDPHSATNARVIVEVLSESTEAQDRGRKLKLYLKLDSLRGYVLIAQDEAQIDKLLRREDGTWTMSIVEGLKEWLELDSIGCRMAMAEIYDGIKFEPTPMPID